MNNKVTDEMDTGGHPIDFIMEPNKKPAGVAGFLFWFYKSNMMLVLCIFSRLKKESLLIIMLSYLIVIILIVAIKV